MTCQVMMSLGVYVLGAADAGERVRIEAHLPGCGACRAELARLTPLPTLLAGLPAGLRPPGIPASSPGQRPAAARPARAWPRRPGQPSQTGHLARTHQPWRTRSGRPGRGGLSWRAVAAACLTAVAGLAGGLWLAPSGSAHRPPTLTLSAADPVMHVSATAALTTTSWGTSIQLRLRGIPLNVPCRLIVRSRTGATEVAGVWDAWRDGPVSIPASADWLPTDIASLQVATPAKTLLTISVSGMPTHPGAPRTPG